MVSTTASNNLAKDVQKPAYLAELTKQMDAKGRLLAKKLYLYSLYMAIDSGKLSTSMIKYSFDLFLANTDLSAKAMQEWMKTPVGTATTASSAVTLIAFSMLARHFDDGDKNLFKRFIATSWPYARDSMKSLRNAYRGVSSTLTLLHLLDIQDLRHLIVPVSLLLGGLSVLNRIWFRYMSSQHNEMIKVNEALLTEIQESKELTQNQIDEIRSKIKEQSSRLRILSLLSSVYSGMIDGINPYIGILGASTLTPPMLTAITVFCGVYFLATFAMRVYDEINLQRKLYIAQNKVELALLAKEIHLITTKLGNISTRGECDVSSATNLCSKYLEHQKIAGALLSTRADTPAVFTGIKNGLATYKYIMLTISTFLFLSPIRLIPALPPINRAILGMSTLVGLSLYSLISKSKTKQQEVKIDIPVIHPTFLGQWIQVIEASSPNQNTKLASSKEFQTTLSTPENIPDPVFVTIPILVQPIIQGDYEKTSLAKKNSQVKNPNRFFSSYEEEFILPVNNAAYIPVY